MANPINFSLEDRHLEQDPNLSKFNFDPGSFRNIYESETGRDIEKALTSHVGIACLIGAIAAAPTRPAVVSTEWIVEHRCDHIAFEDEYKKMTGRMIRQIVEHIGGKFVRRGVRINVESRYGSGAIYRFD
ncbi:hypothetical protein [Loktanella sp. SALINAS62]|uniref:hypothetical protein n=1 Tax=Loktanella sp. SALINAS62 TaxID=2706124 RepID=UPI001B8BD943|nr:hypothetical protein [Loktanella sp. SALINAS62]MBS1301128.1 hypothetical protein [Loktanella sp. SALINAS62]